MKRLLVALLVLATPLWAVEPDELLSDPELERRARLISQEIRCLVCQNESIDESTADVARDLRLLVRERLLVGDSDTEVRDYLVERYGEFVLLRPQVRGANWILWLSGPLLLLIAVAVSAQYMRRKAYVTDEPVSLSLDEQERLEEILSNKKQME